MIANNAEVLASAAATGESASGKTKPDNPQAETIGNFSAFVDEILQDTDTPSGKQPLKDSQPEPEKWPPEMEVLAGEAVLANLQRPKEIALQVISGPGDESVADEGKAPLKGQTFTGKSQTGPNVTRLFMPAKMPEAQGFSVEVEPQMTARPEGGDKGRVWIETPVPDQKPIAGEAQAAKIGASSVPATARMAEMAPAGKPEMTENLSTDKTAGEVPENGSRAAAGAKIHLPHERPPEADSSVDAPAKSHGPRADGALQVDLKPVHGNGRQNLKTESSAVDSSSIQQLQGRPSSDGGERLLEPAAGLAKEVVLGPGQPAGGKPAGQVSSASPVAGELIKQVVAKIRLNKARIPSRATIRLEPPALGKLHVDLQADGHQVSIRMVAENHVVKDLLEANLAHLRHELQQQGMDLKHVEVFVSRDPGDGRQPQGRRRPKENRRFRPAAIKELEEVQPERIRAAGSFDKDGEVDTFA